jgi:hypothetical protein
MREVGMNKTAAFEQGDMKAFEPEAKVGLISTVSPEGTPHITLITSIQAKTPTRLIWGQFSEGFSKKHVKKNPNTGFLILTMDKRLWRGKAKWTHEEKQGEDYEMFNNKPMFRYNAYFGIHTVHYMDLVETYGKEDIPSASIVLSALITKLAKSGARTGLEAPILKPWAQGLFNKLNALKFISHLEEDGFPVIVPVIQCQASDSRRLVFSPLAYGKELFRIEKGKKVAVFGLTLEMEDILVRGTFLGFNRFRAAKLGCIDIEWVYNSMPPKQGQIYPFEAVRPVVNF